MKKHFITKIWAIENNPATKKAIGFANLAQQQMDEMKAENKENARFLSNQLIEARDGTKALQSELEQLKKGTKDENKATKQKPKTESE